MLIVHGHVGLPQGISCFVYIYITSYINSAIFHHQSFTSQITSKHSFGGHRSKWPPVKSNHQRPEFSDKQQSKQWFQNKCWLQPLFECVCVFKNTVFTCIVDVCMYVNIIIIYIYTRCVKIGYDVSHSQAISNIINYPNSVHNHLTSTRVIFL